MTTAIKASLEDVIQKWADKECEQGVLGDRDAWWPDRLTERMAEAAYAVLMANDEGQKYATEQGE